MSRRSMDASRSFLASTSHEIRTPLNAILGMAELLAESPLSPEQRQYVQVCKSAGESLLNLVNDILDLSRIEAGRLELEQTEFNPATVIEEACHVLAFNAQKKGIELTCRIDPARLRQILVNLIGNAVKFTDHGSVAVDARMAEAGGTSSRPSKGGMADLVVTVTDTGPGIPRAKRATIFDRFVQAGTTTAQRRGGAGLGLAIARRGHSMKGSGGAYGFARLTELGAALEQDGAAQKADAVATHINSLAQYLERVEVCHE